MASVRSGVRRVRAALAARATRPASPAAQPAPSPLPPGAERLLALGLFDRPFYEAQCGRGFADDRAAVRHYATEGSGTWSPHPLIDLAYLPAHTYERLTARDAGVHALLHHLTRRGTQHPTSIHFDPTALPVPTADLAAHPGGALGHFLATADAGTPLPGAGGTTLGEARDQLIRLAAEVRRAADLTGRRTSRTWDDEREAAWRRTWAEAPLPAHDGPLVSVVLPVRDRPDLVAGAIASVQAQTLADWELVVVDDGSSDATPAVLARIAAADPRVHVIRQQQAGAAAARNAAIEHARAPYLAFLDSDVTWRPDHLRLAVTAMAAAGHRAAYAGSSFVNDRGRRRYRAFEGGREHLLLGPHVDLSTLVAETALVRAAGALDPALARGSDHDLTIRLAGLAPLAFLPYLAADDLGHGRTDRIRDRESSAWLFVVLAKHWVRWDDVAAALPERVPGRVSVVIPTWNDAVLTHAAVDAVLRNSGDVDLEVVVVDNGSRYAPRLSLQLTGRGDPRVRVLRLPRNLHFATGSNYGFARSTGEHVVFLNNDTQVRPGWLAPLVAHLAEPAVLGVQPLLLYPNETIQSAGTVFPVPGSLPTHFLVGHPPEDALRIRDRDFTAVTAAALAMRAADVVALRGFDPRYVNGMEDVDLCLRAGDLRPGRFRLEPEAWVTHHESMTQGRQDRIPENRRLLAARWSERLRQLDDRHRWPDLGFAIAGHRADRNDVPAARPVTVRTASGLTDPGTPLRWALHLPSPGGESGDRWGDTHFGDALAAALRSLGHEVVTHRRPAHGSPASAYDDVLVALRGIAPVHPAAGKVNVLWVISHPDDVAAHELAHFDLVYAASRPWAEEVTRRTGRRVGVLLQAADLRRRADLTRPPGDGSHPVFVGGAPPDRDRRIVEDVRAAGLTASVHGPGWAGRVPAGLLGRAYVPNEELMDLYRAHGLVLADHWPDMAAHGFIANRLFDAVASGARVISDDIAGLELFEGAVQSYAGPDDLAALCSPAGRRRFPDDAAMAAIADRVAAEHSFDERARRLSADVAALLGRD